jgi:hypothetical protein
MQSGLLQLGKLQRETGWSQLHSIKTLEGNDNAMWAPCGAMENIQGSAHFFWNHGANHACMNLYQDCMGMLYLFNGIIIIIIIIIILPTL